MKTVVDIRSKLRGCVNIVRTAPNGSWVEVELITFGPRGGRGDKHVFRLDLFDATDIARAVQQALTAQAQHLERMRSRARSEGY